MGLEGRIVVQLQALPVAGIVTLDRALALYQHLHREHIQLVLGGRVEDEQ